MRFLNLYPLALLASLASVVLGADFNWDIEMMSGFPKIGFGSATSKNEAVFEFNFTGDVTADKYLGWQLLDPTCNRTADNALTATDNTTQPDYFVYVAIDEAKIASSTMLYSSTSPTAAKINFCLRVDYYFKENAAATPESANFYETIVTINVDLTANFTLTDIKAVRTNATQTSQNVKLDYPVEAYICTDSNSRVTSPLPLTQGDVLQFCVKPMSTVTAAVYVANILTFTLSQPGGSATPETPVTNFTADALTAMACDQSLSGLCNIKTQLLSKFFVDQIPNPLQVSGVAVLGLGSRNFTGIGRRLYVPIRGVVNVDPAALPSAATNEARSLQAAGNSSQQSPFNLVVPVKSTGTTATTKTSGGNSTTMIIIIIVVVVILMAAACCVAFFFMSRKKENKSVEERSEMAIHQSGGTVPYGTPQQQGMMNQSQQYPPQQQYAPQQQYPPQSY